MEILIGLVVLVVIGFIMYVATLAKMSERGRAKEQELDEWNGVFDVKREVDNRLNDPAERKRVRNKYNKSQ